MVLTTDQKVSGIFIPNFKEVRLERIEPEETAEYKTFVDEVIS
jgi:hypothetical protein